MLISLYLLYRYARSGRSKSYLFDIGLFVVLISLVSTFYPLTSHAFLTLPLSFVSFPFYFWRGGLAWLEFHSVRFLTVDYVLLPHYELVDGQIQYFGAHENYGSALAVGFLVFLLANSLGGVLGYLIGSRYKARVLNEKLWTAVGFVFILLWFVGVLAERFFGVVIGERGLMAFFGFGVVVFAALIVSFLVQFVRQGRVPALMVLSGLIIFLTGQNISQAKLVQYEMVVGGQMLVVSGVLAYLLKAAIEYSRTQAPAGTEKRVEK